MPHGDTMYLETIFPLEKAAAESGASFHRGRGRGVFVCQEGGSGRLCYTPHGLTRLVNWLNKRRSPSVQLHKSHCYSACHGRQAATGGVCFRRFRDKQEWHQFVDTHGGSFDALVEC